MAWLLGLGVIAALSALDHTVGLDTIGRERFEWHGAEVAVVGSPGPGRLTVQDQTGQTQVLRFAALPTTVLREQQLGWAAWVQEHAQGHRATIVVERWMVPDPQAQITGDLVWLANDSGFVDSGGLDPGGYACGLVSMGVVRTGVLSAEAALPPEQAYVYRLLESDARKMRRR